MPQTEPPRGRGLGARIRVSLVAVATTGAVLAVAALFLVGARAAFSVAVGAGVATGNLWVLARIVSALLPEESEGARRQSRGGWALLALLKLFGLIGAMWLLMRYGVVAPLPMLIGFGALPMGIAIGSLVSDRSAGAEDR